MIETADQDLHLLPGIAKIAVGGDWVSGGAFTPGSGGGAEMDEASDKADFAREQELKKAGAAPVLLENARGKSGVIGLVEQRRSILAKKDFADIGKAFGETRVEPLEGTLQRPGIQNVDPKFIYVTAVGGFCRTPGEQRKGVLAIFQLGDVFQVGGRNGLADGGLHGQRNPLVNAIV